MKYFYDPRVGVMIAFDDQTGEVYQLQGITLATPPALASIADELAPVDVAKPRKTKKARKTRTVREFQDKDLYPTRKNK